MTENIDISKINMDNLPNDANSQVKFIDEKIKRAQKLKKLSVKEDVEICTAWKFDENETFCNEMARLYEEANYNVKKCYIFEKKFGTFRKSSRFGTKYIIKV